MKKLILGMIISFTMVAFAGALVPQYINYQGILRDSAGNLEDGTFSMIFKIYDAETLGTAVFNAAGNTTSVPVSNGLYNVRLGPVDSSIFDGSNRWLEVTVGSDTLSPRLRINSVAYAITADTVDGISASTEATAGQLLALDANKQLKGVSVSVEASGNNYALYIDGGKIGVKTGSNMSAGTGTISSGSTQTVISNVPLTANSIIILTVGHAAAPAQNNATDRSIKVADVNVGAGTITVRTMDGSDPNPNSIPFSYLVIN